MFPKHYVLFFSWLSFLLYLHISQIPPEYDSEKKYEYSWLPLWSCHTWMKWRVIAEWESNCFLCTFWWPLYTGGDKQKVTQNSKADANTSAPAPSQVDWQWSVKIFRSTLMADKLTIYGHLWSIRGENGLIVPISSSALEWFIITRGDLLWKKMLLIVSW